MVIKNLGMWAVMSSKIITHRSFRKAPCEKQTSDALEEEVIFQTGTLLCNELVAQKITE